MRCKSPKMGKGPYGPPKSTPRSRPDWRRAGNWGSYPPMGALVMEFTKKPSNPQSHPLPITCDRNIDLTPALALQRIRERLELAAIGAGCKYPEQAAAFLLGDGVAL